MKILVQTIKDFYTVAGPMKQNFSDWSCETGLATTDFNKPDEFTFDEFTLGKGMIDPEVMSVEIFPQQSDVIGSDARSQTTSQPIKGLSSPFTEWCDSVSEMAISVSKPSDINPKIKEKIALESKMLSLMQK